MEKLYGKQLEIMATKARLLGLDAVHTAASGHIGGSLSAMDILTTLYFNVMQVDPANPQDPDRDRFVLSKGHCTPALYPVLSLRGFFPQEDLKLFRSIKGHYSGHPDMRHVKGVDMSTGSLGQGISAAVGMALAGKLAKKDYRVYALLGDGEIAEGQVWEAAMSAAKYHLDNLCAVVDVNGLQIDGATKDVMPSEPLDQKFAAFNWNVIHVNGHDLMRFRHTRSGPQPPARQANRPDRQRRRTGVSFSGTTPLALAKAPNDGSIVALAEVEAKLAELEGK